MPNAYVQIACHSDTLLRYHNAILAQRNNVAASSKANEGLRKHIRLGGGDGVSVSNTIEISRPILPASLLQQQDDDGVDDESSMFGNTENTVSLTPALAPTAAAARKANAKKGGGATKRGGGGAPVARRGAVLSADDVAKLFADESGTEAKYYLLILPSTFLEAIVDNLDQMFTDIFAAWSERPNALKATAVLEVVIVGGGPRGGGGGGGGGHHHHQNHLNNVNAIRHPTTPLSLQGRVVESLLRVTQREKSRAAAALARYEDEQQELAKRRLRGGTAAVVGLASTAPSSSSSPPPTGTVAIDSFLVTRFDTEQEACDRTLHIALYFSQLKDTRVRAEVVNHSKRKVDDVNMHKLYTTCLCEIPTVSERRAQVIASTFPSFHRLLAAMKRDDGSFEHALAAATEYGESRKAGLGLAAVIRVALTSVYCTDDEDEDMRKLRDTLHALFGIHESQLREQWKAAAALQEEEEGGGRANTTASVTAREERPLIGAGPSSSSAAQPLPAAASNAAISLSLSSLGSGKKKPRPSAIISLSSPSSEADEEDDQSRGLPVSTAHSNASCNVTATNVSSVRRQVDFTTAGGAFDETSNSRPNKDDATSRSGGDPSHRSNRAFHHHHTSKFSRGSREEDFRGSGMTWLPFTQQEEEGQQREEGGGEEGREEREDGRRPQPHSYSNNSNSAPPVASSSATATATHHRRRPAYMVASTYTNPNSNSTALLGQDDDFSSFGLESLLGGGGGGDSRSITNALPLTGADDGSRGLGQKSARRE